MYGGGEGMYQMGLAGGVHNAKQEKVFERVVFSVSRG